MLKGLNASRSENEKADVDDTDRFLGDVGIAMDQRHAAIVEAMRNSHQAIKDETRNKNMEERQSLHIQLEESLELLWSRLQKSSNSYKTVTEEKRRMYGELLGKDKKGVAEVVENNKKISKLIVSFSLTLLHYFKTYTPLGGHDQKEFVRHPAKGQKRCLLQE